MHLLELLPGQPDVEAGRTELAKVQDVLPVALRDAEDVADHRDGQLGAVPLNDVDDAGFAVQLVEKGVRGLLHAVTQRGDGAGGEHRRDELAASRVVGRLDRQQRRRFDRVQQAGMGFSVDPLQRLGQSGAEGGHPEVVGAQNLVGGLVVDRQQHGTAPDHRRVTAQFVGEPGRIGARLGIGDQPGLRISATACPDFRQPTDDPVQRHPPDSLSHKLGRHQFTLSRGRRSSNRSNRCQM